MDILAAFLPGDRLRAIAAGVALPDRAVGAALFADISGFTALTEAMAVLLGPRRGAEELTRRLNLVYAALIAEVDRHAGSVISFAGDAITCWFDGALAGGAGEGWGASERATACAFALQRAMAPFAALEVPQVGVLGLAIKVAVATGPVRRFVVGEQGLQLIDVLAGALVDRLAEAEHTARPGEVVVDVATRAALGPAAAVGEWRPGAAAGARYAVLAAYRPAGEAPGAPPKPGAPPPAEELRPWLLGPVYAQLRAGQEAFLAELRPATALFLGFGGLDYDADERAPLQLDAFVRWVQRVLRPYEGTILQLSMGDKGGYLYAAFGAPVAHGDAVERAVAAALELAAPPAGLGPIAQARIGISQGRMRAGAYGGPTRRTYGVLGDEVNTAARLMTRARPGQVLITQPVADVVARSFRLGLLERLPVKGKTAAVTVSAVLGRRPPAPLASYAAVEPLAGREAELARFAGVLDGVAAGRGAVLWLEGPAGIGKSRLLAAWAALAAARGVRVAVGACQGPGRQGPYAVWGQLFRALLGLEEAGADVAAQVEALVLALDPSWGERLPLLADLLGLPFADTPTTAAYDPRTRRQALSAFAVDLLAAWARAQPLLLVVEDAHWMDEASRRLTEAVSRAADELPAALALAARPPAGDEPLGAALALAEAPHVQRLELGELAAAEVGALARARLGGPVDELAVALVQSLAAGNPFFSEELIEALREAGALARGPGERWALAPATLEALRDGGALTREWDGGWALAPGVRLAAARLQIPNTVQGAVLARVDRLPEAPRLTLKVASVIGQSFDFDVLGLAHPARPAAAPLTAEVALLEQRAFARPSQPPAGRYSFLHGLTQEVVYDTLLEDQQRSLHGAAGGAVEALRPDAVEELAYHYSRAGVRAKAMQYLDLAARRARAGDANETALAHYTAALALEERAAWRQGQAEVLHILGRRDDERAALEALGRLPAADPFALAYLWGQHFEATGDYGEARSAIAGALALARAAGATADEARCLAQLGLIARRQGDYEAAAASYNAALALFPGEQPRDGAEAWAIAQALNGLGVVLRQRGDFAGAGSCYERAMAGSVLAGDRRGEAEALNGLGSTAYYRRDLVKALAYHSAALAIRRAIGDRSGECASLLNMALAIGDSGDYAEAERTYLAALAIAQDVGNRWEEANIWNALGSLYQELGAYGRAREALRQGMALSELIGDEAGRAYLLANLGPITRDDGDLPVAAQLLREGLALASAQADAMLVSYCLSHLAIVDLLQGDHDQASAHADEALRLRREHGLGLWGTADLATLAAAALARGEGPAAAALAREALAMLDACGGEGPEAPHRDYFACGQVLAATGDGAGAARAYGEARRLVLLRAEKLVDPELRRSFLEEVPLNRAIMARGGA